MTVGLGRGKAGPQGQWWAGLLDVTVLQTIHDTAPRGAARGL